MGEWSHSCCNVGNCQYLLSLSAGVLIISFDISRSRWGNLHFRGLWRRRYVSIQCLLSVVFLALWFVNFSLTLNFKASIIYRIFFVIGYLSYFALWFSLNQMFVIKFSVSFGTDQVERTRTIACYNRGLRSTKKLKESNRTPFSFTRGLKSLLLWWKICILVHLNAWVTVFVLCLLQRSLFQVACLVSLTHFLDFVDSIFLLAPLFHYFKPERRTFYCVRVLEYF